MKIDGYAALLFLVFLNLPARGERIDFSWWDERFAKPGLYSEVKGGYSRDARLPDEEEIHDLNNELAFKTNSEMARIQVVPTGSSEVDPNGFTARSQSDFGRNHAETHTITTGYGESENRQYFDNRSHSMYAESFWVDEWTFSGTALGSATVTLASSLDVTITSSPCASSTCDGVPNASFDRQGFNAWWYRLYGSIRIFDLELIDQLIQPDSDDFIDVPHEVAAFDVIQQGSDIEADSFGPLDTYLEVRNARLDPIHTKGSTSFVPVAGHRYAVVGRIHVQSREGADVDAGHTLSLDRVLLDPGLRLDSIASAEGAVFNIRSSTRLTASAGGGEEVMLSFPTVEGVTYIVEFRNSLGSSDWSILGSKAGNGSLQSLTDTHGGESARFYRLRVESSLPPL